MVFFGEVFDRMFEDNSDSELEGEDVSEKKMEWSTTRTPRNLHQKKKFQIRKERLFCQRMVPLRGPQHPMTTMENMPTIM
ncbi:PiggyBac transposable elementderived protein 4like [Caligus rogercresseyi]|uniref:PiggyBac transposable elementderived protein 4like n=1 Tax=Caligus rogercresseyi TaxID=217165 RepID=A0A7T8QTD0_CALRO|nr:PiggyBac transposable elementderived protein 4like [Caligus rogercresseyi]